MNRQEGARQVQLAPGTSQSVSNSIAHRVRGTQSSTSIRADHRGNIARERHADGRGIVVSRARVRLQSWTDWARLWLPSEPIRAANDTLRRPTRHPSATPLASLRTAVSAAATGAEAPTVTRRQVLGRRAVERRSTNASYNFGSCRCLGCGGRLLCRTRRPTNRQSDSRGPYGNRYKHQNLLHGFAQASDWQEYTRTVI